MRAAPLLGLLLFASCTTLPPVPSLEADAATIAVHAEVTATEAAELSATLEALPVPETVKAQSAKVAASAALVESEAAKLREKAAVQARSLEIATERYAALDRTASRRLVWAITATSAAAVLLLLFFLLK